MQYKYAPILVGRTNWRVAKALRLGIFDSLEEAWAAFNAPLTAKAEAFVEREGSAGCKVRVLEVQADGRLRRVRTLQSEG